ncbi:MAG: GntR family transcriptional regulator, partial [Rhodobacteraceae bacterium]|nr:GntR family transcriptional regulator [Paracoccaceae bacterium]
MDMGKGETADRKVPTHEITYVQLRDMVLTGGLAPGQAVTIQGLIRDLGAGMTPVREAIRRLTAEGALQLHGNRRVSVPNLTEGLLNQIAFARLTIEPKIAELAAAHLTDEAIDQLARIDADIDPAIRAHDIPAYLTGNHRFHFALYEASGAPVLVDIAQSLWLRFGPSLRVVANRYPEARMPDKHIDALAAMRARDGKALAAAIHEDIQQGVDLV